MKKTILIYAVAFCFSACKKGDKNLVFFFPESIFGTYTATITRINPSATYIHTWTITENTSTDVTIISNDGLVGNPLIMGADNNKNNNLTIREQTFTNTGTGGGTFTVSGSGSFSDPQITLSLTQFFSYSLGKKYEYSVSAVKR